MRVLLVVAITILLPSATLAQEEDAGNWTASTSRAEESCSAGTKLDLERWKDFAETLSPAKPSRPMGH